MMVTLLEDLLANSAARAPEASCLEYHGTISSYGDVEIQSNRVARLLTATGLMAGDRVGIFVPKSPVTVLSMLGTLKAGGVYVPMDPMAPSRRAMTIAEDCGISHLVISGDRLASWLNEHPLPRDLRQLVVVGGDYRLSHLPPGIGWVDWDELTRLPEGRPDSTSRNEHDLAYILYTSGSTGKPKGVMLSHRNALAFVDWACREFSLSARDRLSNHAPFHFDLTVFDLYAAFSAGASVSVIDEITARAPGLLLDKIRRARLTIWYSVPSALRLMLDQTDLEGHPPESLRTVLFAGEELPMPYLRRLMRALPNARHYNLYGPTETNVCTFFEVRESDLARPALPIGRACSGAKLFVRVDGGTEPKPGEIGELYVRGPTVMLGYWPERRNGDDAYPTGDLVVWEDAENLSYHGRNDFMVKVRGFRIELREVEVAIGSHPGVRDVAVSVIDEPASGKMLVAHVVAREENLSVLQIKTHCAKTLPWYMIPHRVQLLSALPTMSNGKVDRVRLRLDSEQAQSTLAGGRAMSESMVAAVAGASGLTGAALVAALVQRGYRVRALVRRRDAPVPFHRSIELEVGDLADPDSRARLCNGAQLVFNAAGCVSDWGPAREFWDINCTAVVGLCEAALSAGVSRFVHISTVDVFGFQRHAVIDERSPRRGEPHPYSASKLQGEERAWEFSRRGLPVSVIYPTWIFGPGDRHFLPELVTALKTGQMVLVDGGTPHMEVTYSENLAQACLLVAEDERATGEGYIVGDGYGVNLGEFVRLLAERIGIAHPQLSLPYPLAYGLTALVEHGYALFQRGVHPPVTRYAIRAIANGGRYDLSKIQSLGYRPEVGLYEAISRSLTLEMPPVRVHRLP